MPARAPPSIDMLHSVMRPSIVRLRMAAPVYSITWPVPPPVPMVPMMASIRSLAVEPGQAQAVESLGRCDLVHEVAIDVEQRAPALPLGDHVRVRDLLEQRLGH